MEHITIAPEVIGPGCETGGASVAEHLHDMIERQVNHMTHLAYDLMEVSRITRGKVDLRLEKVELAGIVRSAIETSRPRIDSNG